MFVTIKLLKKAGFTVSCVYTNGGHDLDLVWLATKGGQEFLIQSWFGDKSERYVGSVEELISGEHGLSLHNSAYLLQPYSSLSFEARQSFVDGESSPEFTFDGAEDKIINLMSQSEEYIQCDECGSYNEITNRNDLNCSVCGETIL